QSRFPAAAVDRCSMRARRLGTVWVSLVLVGASVAFVGGAGPAGAQVRTIVQKVASGVTLTKIYDPSGPFRIRVLTIDPTKAVMLDVALSTPTFGSFAKTSSMARAGGAIAA